MRNQFRRVQQPLLTMPTIGIPARAVALWRVSRSLKQGYLSAMLTKQSMQCGVCLGGITEIKRYRQQ
jgi:hypothetical protein